MIERVWDFDKCSCISFQLLLEEVVPVHKMSILVKTQNGRLLFLDMGDNIENRSKKKKLNHICGEAIQFIHYTFMTMTSNKITRQHTYAYEMNIGFLIPTLLHIIQLNFILILFRLFVKSRIIQLNYF